MNGLNHTMGILLHCTKIVIKEHNFMASQGQSISLDHQDYNLHLLNHSI